MKIPTDPEWDEFRDPEYADWKRVRLAIEHENDLTNHRQTWLLTTQAFLLTSFGFIFRSFMESKDALLAPTYLWVLGLHGFAGIFLSLFLRAGIQAAKDQHDRLHAWWEARARTGSHPPLVGEDARMGLPLPYSSQTFVFIAFWISVLVILMEGLLRPYFRTILVSTLALIVSSGLIALGILIGRRRSPPKP